jgi:RNA polymerase sigma factor (sigma-70 family)
VTSISLAMVRDVPTSEEVAQEVFVTVWRDLGALRNGASFLPWLRQLTRHRALDALRRRRRGGDAATARGGADEEAVAHALDPRPDAQATLLAGEESRVLHQALDAVADDVREVLTLYYREGRSIAQVARLLGLREPAARKRLERARAALHEEVLARFGEMAESTRPSDAFSAAVLGALPAATGTGSVAALAVKSGSTLYGAPKLLALAGSGALGMLFALPGIVSGLRKALRKARDAQERRDLLRLGAVSIVNTTVFCLVCGLVKPLAGEHWRAVATAWVLAYAASHLVTYLVWLPRIRARRLAMEVAEDPAAALRHRRERRRALFWGAFAGILGAGVPITVWWTQ